MKKIFFSLIFCFPFLVFSQCMDSLVTPNPYAHCPQDYVPVCACDGKIYRNSCAAEQWGAISPGYYISGPCDDFDIDLYPDLIFTAPEGVPHLSIYMKFPGTATVTIYSSMGRLLFEKLFSTNQNYALIPGADPYDLQEAQAFPRDVYIIIVTVNGNKKSRKFIKVDK